MSGLVLDAVSLALAGRPLFPPVTLAVAPGTVATLTGPSGVGKSSLLAFVSGALGPGFTAAGRVRLDGADLTDLSAHHRRIGILFQDDLLFPHLSVAGNLAFALPASLRGRDRRARIDTALTEIGLAGFAGRDPATLSGGQRSRVALLRALLAEPRALLLDEPFARLDGPLGDRIRTLVFDRARRAGLPVLMVTHDPADAIAAGGPVLALHPVDAGAGAPDAGLAAATVPPYAAPPIEG